MVLVKNRTGSRHLQLVVWIQEIPESWLRQNTGTNAMPNTPVGRNLNMEHMNGSGHSSSSALSCKRSFQILSRRPESFIWAVETVYECHGTRWPPLLATTP